MGIEILHPEIIDLVLCHVPILDYYNLRLAGSRYLTEAVRAKVRRISRSAYMLAIQEEDLRRRLLSTPSGRLRYALQIMIERGQSAMVLHYIRKYENLGFRDFDPEYHSADNCGRRPWQSASFFPAPYWAARYGQEAILRLFLDRVNYLEKYTGFVPLHYAAQGDQTGTANLLLENGAYINALCTKGVTPLGVALQHGARQTAELLRSKGGKANVHELLESREEEWTQKFMNPATPRDEIASLISRYLRHLHGVGDALLYFCRYRASAPGSAMEDGQHTLREAVRENRIYIISTMLDEGWDINRPLSPSGCCALHYVERDSQLATAEFLLDNGADTAGDFHYIPGPLFTVFHMASLKLQKRLIKFYLSRGVSVDHQNSEGETALHLAIARGRVSEVKFLLGKGASVHTATNRGSTALHLVSKGRGIDEIKSLVQAAAESEVQGGMWMAIRQKGSPRTGTGA